MKIELLLFPSGVAWVNLACAVRDRIFLPAQAFSGQNLSRRDLELACGGLGGC